MGSRIEVKDLRTDTVAPFRPWNQRLRRYITEVWTMRGFMRFLSGVAMVLWLAVSLFCLFVPPYLVFKYHIRVEFLWFIALGLALGLLWFVVAYEMRKE